MAKPRTKSARRANAEVLQLPELVKPDGVGYMPLYCAAQWIATHGGTRKINPLDEVLWHEAYKALLDHIASENVKVLGVRSDGATETISGTHFASCQVNYPFSDVRLDLTRSKQLCLFSRPYLDDEHWRGGFDDTLEDRRGVRWRRLMVLKADVARYWPFAATLDCLTGEPRERPPRKRQLRERAQKALDTLHPNGVPDQTTVSDAELVRAVNLHILRRGGKRLSRETILRAAERRR